MGLREVAAPGKAVEQPHTSAASLGEPACGVGPRRISETLLEEVCRDVGLPLDCLNYLLAKQGRLLQDECPSGSDGLL